MRRVTVCAVVVLCLSLSPNGGARTTVDDVNKYAWFPNVGWINWQGDVTHGAVLTNEFASGYIFSGNIGWIALGDGSPVNGSSYSNASAEDCGVNVDSISDPGNCILSGFAWSGNIGWINFSVAAQAGVQNQPRIVKATGVLKGYAWSANAGWVCLESPGIAQVVTVLTVNHPPSFTNARIDPSPAFDTDTLSVICSGWSDPEGDPEGYLYQWKKNEAEIHGATSSTLVNSNFVAGDRVSCVVSAWDGKTTGTVIETAPVTILHWVQPVARICGSLEGKTRRGNRTLVKACIIPANAWMYVKNVQFQYRPHGSGPWSPIPAANINHPNPDATYPFFIHWDLTSLADGQYDVRAVATDIHDNVDPNPEFITFTVDSHCHHWCGLNGRGETECHDDAFRSTETTISSGDSERHGCADVSIPADALDDDTTISLTHRTPSDFTDSLSKWHSIDHFVELRLGNGQSLFSNGKKALLTFEYQDADNDGIVDDYGIPEENLRLCGYDGSKWSVVDDFQIDTLMNRCTGSTKHFSVFAVLASPEGSSVQWWSQY